MTKTRFLLALACTTAAAFGCVNSNPATKSQQDNSMVINLEINPKSFSITQIEAVTVTLRATNNGSETADPRLDDTTLRINGEPSFAWSLTTGNGKRTEDWRNLAPGKSTSMTWESLARSLFPEAGTYALQLQLDDSLLQSMEVEVLP